MNHFARRSIASVFTLCFASAGPVTLAADAAAAPEIKTQADFEAAVAAADPAVKEALRAHGPAILAAVTRRPHVEFVVAALDKASASYEKANATPEALRKALGRDLPAFDTLKTVNLGMAALGVKGKRTTDPFDHAFYEHVGEITDLESLTIINTTAQDADLAPLAKLRGLKALNIINQGKLTDEGLVHLKGLSRLERFAYVGTQLKGHPFKEFAGWTRLKSASFRGSKIDDEGIAALCDHFPALESISLAHANFTDAGAATLAKLKNLKGLELGLQKGTPEALRHVLALPLEYLQLGEGVGTPAGVAIVKDLKTLRKLVITDAKKMTDAELAVVSNMTQLEHVELGGLEITAERMPAVAKFAYLKSMRLVKRPVAYDAETQGRIKAALPKVALQFE